MGRKRSKKNKSTGGRQARRSPKAGRGASRQDADTPNAAQSTFREWVSSLVFAFAAMLCLHMFIFQPFVVPTPSMAGTVLPGEYLIVSKLHYGPKTPGIVGIPYTELYVEGIDVPSFRLPGFGNIKRGDVVVFHYPPENEHPIDRRQPYLKRALGLPGETFAIQDKRVFIDGSAIEDVAGVQQFWDIYKTDARIHLSVQKLKNAGIEEVIPLRDPTAVRVIASSEVAAEIASWPYVDRVEPYIDRNPASHGNRLFPSHHQQTPDNYGPIWIPAAGDSISLDEETWSIYGPTIEQHEFQTVTRTSDGAFLVDGEPTDTYVFDQSYYFMIGDNRDNSLDSRYWGFVPENHIMGKAVARFYSWDKEAGWPRFHRMFDRIR